MPHRGRRIGRASRIRSASATASASRRGECVAVDLISFHADPPAGVWFGYDGRAARLARASASPCRRPASSASSGRTDPARRRSLRMLAGTRQPQRGGGDARRRAAPRSSRTALARRMAVVPQETQLAFDYTVARGRDDGPLRAPRRVRDRGAARPGGIEDERCRPPGRCALKDRLFATLSGGEKQRVVIAAALAQISVPPEGGTRPPLQAEEPRLSPARRADGVARPRVPARSRRAAAASSSDRRVAIVISTHDLELAATLCDTPGAAPRRHGRRERRRPTTC